HWLEMGKRVVKPPKVFHVNWFRKGEDGRFLWPGYGENVRVLKWMLERTEGRANAAETPIGFVPAQDSLTLDGLQISPDTMRQLLNVDSQAWVEEQEGIGKFFDKFGKRLPEELAKEFDKLGQRLQQVAMAQK
ncbi:MAG TPA: phosphoenolpyruvate carboxykinase domain-containing protein, partial [Candidatus Acidoferrum sp.]|nr:phosphoenolpyruvate carboxykinase domain-containing protein [Candidatus Acidoferrum sp.]